MDKTHKEHLDHIKAVLQRRMKEADEYVSDNDFPRATGTMLGIAQSVIDYIDRQVELDKEFGSE
jgi:hypothetical protein